MRSVMPYLDLTVLQPFHLLLRLEFLVTLWSFQIISQVLSQTEHCKHGKWQVIVLEQRANHDVRAPLLGISSI